jgi:hypothetical protein
MPSGMVAVLLLCMLHALALGEPQQFDSLLLLLLGSRWVRFGCRLAFLPVHVVMSEVNNK